MNGDAMRHSAAGAVVATILLWAGLAWSVPTSIQHQGRLLQQNGDPMTGQATLKFTIYDAKTGGSIIWQSAAKQVSLGDSGFYSVTLGGTQNPIDSSKLSGGRLWIGLKVNQNAELSPRIPIRSVPYAIRSETADSVADGAVGKDQLQNGAVTSQKVASVNWSKVQNKPQTLGSLSCSSGQVAEYDGTQWRCGSSGTPLAGQSCSSGHVAGVDGSGNLQCGSDQNTTYSAGAGLNLSGTTFELSDQSCSGAVTAIQNGQLQCTTVGDITAVNAGTGLSGGGNNGSVTIDADYSQIQQRVSGSCSGGEVMTGINQDGSVNCQLPGDTSGPGTSSGCSGSFIALQTCPVGSELSAPDCDEVAIGGICEYDYCSSGSLDNGLDNCGAGDFYLREN